MKRFIKYLAIKSNQIRSKTWQTSFDKWNEAQYIEYVFSSVLQSNIFERIVWNTYNKNVTRQFELDDYDRETTPCYLQLVQS